MREFGFGEVVRPGRFELPTLCLEGRRSIQLSYGRILGYSFDSTKVAKAIRHRILPKSWNNLEQLERAEHLRRGRQPTQFARRVTLQREHFERTDLDAEHDLHV